MYLRQCYLRSYIKLIEKKTRRSDSFWSIGVERQSQFGNPPSICRDLIIKFAFAHSLYKCYQKLQKPSNILTLFFNQIQIQQKFTYGNVFLWKLKVDIQKHYIVMIKYQSLTQTIHKSLFRKQFLYQFFFKQYDQQRDLILIDKQSKWYIEEIFLPQQMQELRKKL